MRIAGTAGTGTGTGVGPGVGRGAVVVLSLALVLTGCTNAPGASPSPTRTPSPSSTATTDAPTPPSPSVNPALSAEANLRYFDLVASNVVAADPNAGGRSFVDALAQAGFDRSQMEVGFDRTAANLAVDSVQFSVRFSGKCLIGQYGPASGGYHGEVAAVLGSGRCLIGVTRQIDW